MTSMNVSHLRLQRYSFFSIRQAIFFKKNQNFNKSLIISDLFFIKRIEIFSYFCDLIQKQRL